MNLSQFSDNISDWLFFCPEGASELLLLNNSDEDVAMVNGNGVQCRLVSDNILL